MLSLDCRHRYPSGFELQLRFECAAVVTALFGPSGSGKTTVLSILAGHLRPDAGRITLGERVLVDTAAAVFVPPEQRRIGVVFQDHRLFPHLTVRKNLEYGQSRSGARRVDFQKVVHVLEIDPLLDRLPRSLSGGQQQRVALGRALLQGPELLLMDEPLAALDEPLKERILDYLERVIEAWQIPTVFVSHDQGDVRRLAQDVVVIGHGRLVASGPTATTLDQAIVGSAELNQAVLNFLPLHDVRQEQGAWQGQTDGGQWIAFTEPPPDPRRAFATFSSREVLLSTTRVADISVRNQLSGKVTALLERGDEVFVSVQLGKSIVWAQVTRGAVAELKLRPGAEVFCLVKAVAVHVDAGKG
jgi:molybdate transport system ATP-binding protein